MPTPSKAYFWEAQTRLKVSNLAFNVQAEDKGKGASQVRELKASWLRDGKVYFNPSQRLKGWFKQQLPLVRSSYQTQVQAIKTFPLDGKEPIAIAEAKDLKGGDKELLPTDKDHRLPDGLPWPKHRFIISYSSGKPQSVPLYWVELVGPITVGVKIICFARGITPQIVEEALNRLGRAVGIGDKANHGYGTFEVEEFNYEQEEMKI